MSWNVRNIITGILDISLAVIAFFIGLRIVFKLFAANSATPFVAWVYRVSDNLVYPFAGIFPNLSLQTGVFDIVAVIALVAYIILIYLIIALIDSAVGAVSRYFEHRQHQHIS